jgi:hypothetical protein
MTAETLWSFLVGVVVGCAFALIACAILFRNVR